MTKDEVWERIMEVGLIPVVRATSAEHALLAAEAIRAGGISIIEVTMTVPGAIRVITELVRKIGKEVLIGAGTVLDDETAKNCIEAGAEFIVSPGFDRETVEAAERSDKLVIAGALTPTEILAAWKAGSDLVKVFPCGSVGGPKYIRALKAPLPHIPLVPTGGVNLDTAGDFIRAGATALGIGAELCQADALKTGHTEVITETARKLLSIVKEARAGMKTSA